MRVAAFVAGGALLVVIAASAVAPSAPPDLSPFEASPTAAPPIVQVINGAQNAIGAAASAIAAPFRSTPTPTPATPPIVPTTQATPRGSGGGQPSTPPGQLRTPQPTPIHP